jgi:uncharacterized membrane protein YoaK (UPF0700 family)
VVQPAPAVTPSPALRALLIVLTGVTGLVDAVSYLGVGHVFVANMTGNVALLGFALSGATGLSIAASLVALAGFLAGAVAGGRLALTSSRHRRLWLTTGSSAQTVLVSAAAGVMLVGPLVGGVLTLHAGLPTALAVTAAVLAVVTVAFAVVVPDTER